MKRLCAFVLCIALLCACLPGLAENGAAEHYAWNCPNCGRIGEKGNYCGNCAHPSPWIEAANDETDKESPEQSAEEGSDLGAAYENGDGVEQSYEKAVYYYQLAADQGNAAAQAGLGYMYAKGSGIEQNYEKALYYSQLAADQGNAAAQYNLGIIFQYGKGVIENSGKAKYYYQLAAEQGNEDAAKALKALSGK